MTARNILMSAAGGTAGPSNYIEDFFSPYIYSGNGTTQTITNNVALKGRIAYKQATTGFTTVFSGNVGTSGETLAFSRSSSNIATINKTGTTGVGFQSTLEYPVGTDISTNFAYCAVDSSGNNYISTIYASGGQRYYTLHKISADGSTLLWSKRFGETNNDLRSYTITTDNTNVYMTGYTGDPNYVGYILAVSCSTGDVVWAKKVSSSYGGYNYDCAVDNGNLYVVGYVSFGAAAVAAVQKITASTGARVASVGFNISDTIAKGVDTDSSGNVYVVGTQTSQNYFITKRNSSLTEVWTKTFQSGSNAADMISVAVGNTYTALYMGDTSSTSTSVVILNNSDGSLVVSGKLPSTTLTEGRRIYYNNGVFYLFSGGSMYSISEASIISGYHVFATSGPNIYQNSVTWLVGGSGSYGDYTSYTVSTTTHTYTRTATSYTPTPTSYDVLVSNGGLVWFKTRFDTEYHTLFDTARGTTSALYTNATNAAGGPTNGVTSFNSNGFTVGSLGAVNGVYGTPTGIASWTFRKQPKFFDVVTYTGTGGGPFSVAHNLGSTPGFLIIKSTSRVGNWVTIARQSNGTYALFTDSTSGLQSTAAAYNTSANPGAALSATTFDPSWFNNDNTPGAVQNICDNGVTYVAYLFANDAGGFGLTGTDNVVSCGSFTSDSSANFSVTLGYEPQFVMCKSTNNTGPWFMLDTMRGYNVSNTNSDKYFMANSTSLEGEAELGSPTATGFVGPAGNVNTTYIYIAIRRPMKIPTSGSEVFLSQFYYGQSEGNPQGFIKQDMAIIPDTVWIERISGGTGGSGGQGFHGGNVIFDRLRSLKGLYCARYNNTPPGEQSAGNTGVLIEQNSTRVVNVTDGSSYDYDVYDQSIGYQIRSFKRSRNVFETVYYTGNSTNGRSVVHNLGVAPELMLVKKRTYSAFNSSVSSTPWAVYYGNSSNYLTLDTNEAAATSSSYWNNTSPTLSSFTLGNNTNVNLSNDPYVAYLFSTLAGVSKVGTYTGNGSSQTINCGFSAGARFILIKRIDSTGSWYVFDSARGIVSGNDPYFTLNTNEAEFPYLDVVDPASSGFIINQESTTNLNVTAASYVYLAIA